MLYEVMCIAMAIYWEARGEPVKGQFAVGQVVMNRVHDPRYPSDACSVVYDGGEVRNECQFSFFCDGKSDQPTDYVPRSQMDMMISYASKYTGNPESDDCVTFEAPLWAFVKV